MGKLLNRLLLRKRQNSNLKLESRKKDENERLLQSVFNTTNQAIAVFQAIYNDRKEIEDFKFIKINKILKEMYNGKDPLGKTYKETSEYGIKMGILEAFVQVMETKKPLDREFHFDKEDYNNWFRITARSQDDLLIATLEDITTRKEESESLKDLLRFKQQLEVTSPETIMIINLNTFCVRYINKDLLPEAGMTVERIQGTSLPDILPYIHPRDREKLIGFHKKLLKSEDHSIHEQEIRLKLRNNQWEWFCIRGKIFQRKDTKWVDEYVLLVSNITEQRNTKEALLKAERLSIQGEVARIFAHELRNPIANMRMATDLISKKISVEEKEKINRYLEILSTSNQTLNDLINNLLDASNYTTANMEYANLVDIMEEAIDKASERIYLAGIELIKDYENEHFIVADRNKLVIALLNLIVNASEATIPQEGIIKIKIYQEETEIILKISDNGHGLNHDELDRIFDAFYTQKETGVGVGLTSVKHILEEHDAKVEVESIDNRGTTFILSFPKPEKNNN